MDIWTCCRLNEDRTPKKVLNMKVKSRLPKRVNKVKTGTTGKDGCHTEGRKSVERN
jgi:hypothetical protein